MKRLFPSAVFRLDSFLMLTFEVSLSSRFCTILDIWFADISQSVACLFILLVELFTEQKV